MVFLCILRNEDADIHEWSSYIWIAECELVSPTQLQILTLFYSELNLPHDDVLTLDPPVSGDNICGQLEQCTIRCYTPKCQFGETYGMHDFVYSESKKRICMETIDHIFSEKNLRFTFAPLNPLFRTFYKDVDRIIVCEDLCTSLYYTELYMCEPFATIIFIDGRRDDFVQEVLRYISGNTLVVISNGFYHPLLLEDVKGIRETYHIEKLRETEKRN